ncbi:MAG TPA: hypothetical protein ENO10_06590 [Salinimicrobium catena]|uniref:Uncharacterized protein n=1 Tax=Salinimicrobium catena TaxID=390640 RepID=A0A7C2QZL8_9FLAO|nr:hypothetical protein [Salinimicrobium catena]
MGSTVEKRKARRKRFTVYIIYLVSSVALFLVYLQYQLFDWGLWPFSYPEISFIAFSFLFLFSILRLLVSLPFLIKSIRKEPKDLSLSLPPLLAVAILVVTFYDTGNEDLCTILGGIYIISGFIFGVYGIQKLRNASGKVQAYPPEGEVRAREKTAKFLYFIFITSGLIGLFLSLVSYFPGRNWWPADVLLDIEMLVTIQLFLLGAGIFRLLYHFSFFLFLFRHGWSNLGLTIPLILLFLGGVLKLLAPGSGLSMATDFLYSFSAILCGIMGFYKKSGNGVYHVIQNDDQLK